jgi:hypothetical protein
MENKLIESDLNTIALIKKQYKLNIELASFQKGFIPNYILLDKTRNIHSYIVVADYDNSTIGGYYFNKDIDFNSILIELLKIQYSTLDRPLFLILNSKNKFNVIECSFGYYIIDKLAIFSFF